MASESPAAPEAPTTGGPGSRGRYPKGVRRRQEILDRAIEVLAEVGFEGASLRAVGEAIGVSHAALRRYFDTREDLFLEVLREKDRQALAEAHALDRRTLGLSESLEAFASSVPGLMALRHSMVARALEAGNERSRGFFVERYAALREEALRTLVLAREAGVVRDDVSLDAAAALVIATLDGLSTQWLLDPGVDMHHGVELLERLLAPPPG
ncbi:TetR/AcrR family transcriptional regulator [Microlunatus spumicola]|uniref:TetR/AcrR family transcriptional regulator n=1 Tax=Microlunatus spumicola TaxID=81499 RepID=A0ABP6WS86_9ACTN